MCIRDSVYTIYYFVGENIFQLHTTIFLNYNVMSFMLIIYFLVIILNIALLIVFAILTYFEFVLKGRNGFLKLFFVLFEISYIILFFFYPKKFKLKVEKGIFSVFYCFSANSITAQATIFNFYASFLNLPVTIRFSFIEVFNGKTLELSLIHI